MVADMDSQAQMKYDDVPVPVAADTDRSNEIFPAENEDEEN
ncbi:hypothetical protein T09_13919 [Trichinella sp. T9]|nr:hypothetical protein T09_13919 [Trichinella sp. T9]